MNCYLYEASPASYFINIRLHHFLIGLIADGLEQGRRGKVGHPGRHRNSGKDQAWGDSPVRTEGSQIYWEEGELTGVCRCGLV